MTNATIPQFGTIPVAEMAKPKSVNYESAEVQARREAFSKFLKSIKPGVAGVISLTQSSKDGKTVTDARSVRMQLRYASEQTGIKVEKTVVTDTHLQFTVAGSNGATAAA